MPHKRFKNVKRFTEHGVEVLPSLWPLVLVLFSYIVMFTALILFLYGFNLLYQRWRPPTFSELSQEIPVTEVEALKRVPVLMSIKSIDLVVTVVQGEVKEGEWVVSEDAVSVVSTSESVTSGLIVYGHNYPRLLGGLSQVKAGDEVVLAMKNGDSTKYVVTDMEVVSPHSIYSLTPGDFTDLVIYTCTGFLDSKRLVVKAELRV